MSAVPKMCRHFGLFAKADDRRPWRGARKVGGRGGPRVRTRGYGSAALRAQEAGVMAAVTIWLRSRLDGQVRFVTLKPREEKTS